MKPFQKPALYCNFQPFSRVVISAKHLEIVCVSHYVHMLQIAPLEFRISTRTVEHPIRPGTPYFTWRWVVDWYASPLAMYSPIKFIEYDVRKQWAENTALRRTLLRNSSLSVFLDRCFQHSAYDAQQTFVAYSQTPKLF